MSWALRGLGGPLKDQTFPLSGGTTIGRQGNIVVMDHKSSSIHARIGVADDGTLFLEDNSSKNGTRVDGERISRVPLTNGLVFFIGDQGLEVFEILDESAQGGQATPAVVQPKVRRPWNDILGEFLALHEAEFSNARKPAAALQSLLVLEFVRGVQANSKWTLGYVPRKIGAGVMDLPIWEPGAPEVCFELLPSFEGVLFKTAHPNIVLLNGVSVDSRTLSAGDTIRIQETTIEVEFKE